MSMKRYKPTTAAQRGKILFKSDNQYSEAPKSLTKGAKRGSGRNNQGKLTVRHKGGGAKRSLRIIDFSRKDHDIPCRVAGFVHDPYRNADLAHLIYANGKHSLIVATSKMKLGDVIFAGENVEPHEGNCLPLANIPVGSVINNVEINPGAGAKLARSAGTSITLMAKDGAYCVVKLPSGEMRYLLSNCKATMGAVCNEEVRNERSSSAGRSRHKGIRPTVRGAAMNACDHPHGGGEGKAPVGRKHPMTYKGKIGRGVKTSSRVSRRTKSLFIR